MLAYVARMGNCNIRKYARISIPHLLLRAAWLALLYVHLNVLLSNTNFYL